MPRKRLFSLLAILTLLISLTIAVPIAQGDGPDDFTVPEKSESQYPNLGSHLSQVISQVELGRYTAERAATESPIHSGESIAVTVFLTSNVDDVVQFLEDNGGDPRNVGEDYIEAYVPVTLLGQLSEQPGVTRVQEIIPPEPAYGNVTSQGVQTHLSQAWNNAGYSGQGVKVGVIDVDFEGFSRLRGQELPFNVAARCYTDVGVFTSNLSDCEGVDPVPDDTAPQCVDVAQRGAELSAVHGTAVAESLIDIAPDVSLYIANPISQADLQRTVDWMASQGVQVINYSVGWTFDGPGDGTSPSSVSPLNTVDQAVANDILWVNSAGNYADNTWFGDYSDPDGDRVIGFDGQNDEIIDLTIVACRGRLALLRWEDSWDAANTDLDLVLYHIETGTPIFVSDFEQSGENGQIPLEGIRLLYPFDTDELGLGIVYHSGPVPDWIQLEVRGAGGMEHSTASYSITNPAESANPGLLAVGATHYWDTHTIADYSSQGPTPDGRVKPDIVGTACAETVSYEHYLRGGQDCWFSGTSQASPHVAGLAALVLQRFPHFTPDQVADYLKHYAQQRATPDPNSTWGHGFAELPSPDDGEPASDFDTSCREMLNGDEPVDGRWAPGCESAVEERGHARYHTFTLGQESDVTITLESGDADAYLYVRDGEARSGAFLYQNDDHDDAGLARITDSRIQATLEAGTYTIEATTYEAGETGSFTLSISGLTGAAGAPTPDGDDCLDTLTADGTVSGSWAAGCESEARSGSHARYYSFTLEQESDVTIVLESGDADTYLYLRDGNAQSGSFRLEDDDSPDTTRSEIQADDLPAGTYTIEATTYGEGETGSFTLTITGLGGSATPTPGEDDCGQDLPPSGTVNASWAAGCESQARSGSHARYYSFTLEQESDVTIVLESGDADTYLNLWQDDNRTGTPVAFDDDSPDTSRSEIARSLAAGSYTIEATTYEAGETGSFTLTVTGLGGAGAPTPGADECGETLAADDTVSGSWAAGCESQARSGSHARYYNFTLAQQSDVTIVLESGDADTYLNLWQDDNRTGTPVAFDDDSPDTSRSEIARSLAAGTYTIEATTYGEGETGSFTLSVTGLGAATAPTPGADECEQDLPPSDTVDASWAAGCESQARSGSLARYYSFTLEQESDVTIVLESGDADTYLNLWQDDNRTGTPVAFDDDSPDTSRSEIARSLAAGSYTIEATTYEAGETGSFTLTVTGLGAAGDSASDRAALVAFYNATDGDNWTNNSDWLTDAPSANGTA